MTKTFTIRKGNHYSQGWSLSSPFITRSEMVFDVLFSESCMKLPGKPECDGDFNKLFGWSYGWHHSNSLRIGWRVDPNKPDSIRLVLYLYENGKRRTKGFVNIFHSAFYRLGLRHNHQDNTIIAWCDQRQIMDKWNGSRPAPGYGLNPYYGGDCPAPETMQFIFL